MRNVTASPAWAQRVFHLGGALAALLVAVLAWQSSSPAPIPLALFGGLCAGIFVCSLIASWAARCTTRVGVRHILAWCTVLRVIAVCGDPIYEDDYFRYLWDGRQTVEHGTPYAGAPADAFASEDDPLWSAVLDQINNPALPTIYGPVNQYVFAVAYWLRPGEVTVLQAIFAVVDLLVLVLLSRMAGRPSLVLYGFSPLILKEFSFTAHPDILSVFALVLATFCWRRQHLYLAALALAMAVSAKVFALLLVPLLLRWHWRAWGVFALTTIVLHLPLAHLSGMGEALSAMAGSWLFNAPLYTLLLPYVDFQTLKVTLVTCLAALCTGYFFRASYARQVPPQPPRGDVLFFAMLLASPAFNPWYFVFPLVFAVIYPTVWAWTGSLSILFAYATGLQLGTRTLELYQQPAWSLWAGFLPILVAALVPTVVRGQSQPFKRSR